MCSNFKTQNNLEFLVTLLQAFLYYTMEGKIDPYISILLIFDETIISLLLSL